MFKYIISALVVVITVFLIYKINVIFENIKIKDKSQDLIKINIESDCVVILSRDSCPYCKILYEELNKNYNKSKYTIIKINPLGNLVFDDTFINLDISERENIIQEVTKLANGMVSFPTILVKNKIYKGLPQPEKIKEIFN